MQEEKDRKCEEAFPNSCLFKFSILLRGIGIIEAHNQDTLVMLLVMLIEQSGFRMADM